MFIKSLFLILSTLTHLKFLNGFLNLAFFIFYITNIGISQSSKIFRHISKKDGLSQISVFSLAQDNSGFLWFGTRDGLDRYDGYNFKNYKNESSSNSLVSNDIRVIYNDNHTGDLWIGTNDGLSHYRSSLDDFENFKNDQNTHSLSSNEVLSIFIDSKKRLWVGTSFGLNLFDPKTSKFSRYMYSNIPSDQFYKRSIDAIIQDKDGTLWFGTDDGLFYLDENKLFSFIRKDGANSSMVLTNSNINALLQDKKGNIWIGTEKGLNYWETSTNNLTYYKHIKGNQNSLSNDNVRTMCLDGKGAVWIGTFDGLNVFDENSKSFQLFKKNETGDIGLSDNSIRSIMRDSRGGMWVGTYYGGVNHTDANYHRFENFVHSPFKNSIGADVVSSFVEDPSGNFWIGTEGGGLNYYDVKTKLFKSYKNKEDSENTISGNNVKQVLLDGNKLWIGTFTQGLNLFDIQKQKFSHFKNDQGNAQTISNNNVYGLHKEGKYLWILTYGGGLDIFDTETSVFTNSKKIVKDVNGLSSDLTRVFLKTKDGNVWIGTEKGINKVIKDERGFPKGFTYYLKNEKIFSLQEDNLNRIWIGTLSNGLFIYDRQSEEFRHLTTKDGLPGNTIFGILEDDNKKIWLSTNNGLSKYDPLANKFSNFGPSSGLENIEYNFNAYYKASSGDLLFGGINGFTKFNPKEIITNNFLPQVAFTQLRHKNKVVQVGDASGLLTKSINNTTKIVFPYNEANFSISFAALDFLNPKNNHYAYKLEHLDKDWNYTVGQTDVSYTIQREGKYMFHLKGGNSDGLFNPEERLIEIVVLPPPWRSWWAYLLYLATVALILYSLYRFVNIRHALQLENIARKQEDELHEMKLRFFTNITHELRTPLTLILGPIKELLSKDHSNENLNKLITIDRNARRLLNLVNQVLVFRKLASDHEPMSIKPGNIVYFVKEIFLAFKETAESREIEYTFFAQEDDMTIWFDMEKMEKVFFNLLANAFKFTPNGGKIQVKIYSASENVHVKVIDNGIGVDPALQEQIFQRFYEKTHVQKSEIKGTGIGLAICKQMVELHHGKIDIESDINQGATFTVFLKKGNQHFTKKELDDNRVNINVKTTEIISEDLNEFLKEEEIIHPINTESEESTSLKEQTLLIVEDNAEVRDYICHLFTDNYHILVADNGENGLKMARKHHPDLIISDVMMPVMDGITMARALKEDLEISHLPVILLTARTASLYKIEGLTVGADDYITKPFDPEELRLRVKNILAARKEARDKFARVLTFDPKAIDVTSADEVFLSKAMELVESNIGNYEYNVDQFAFDLAVSRPLLFIKLKALTDQTPNNFIKTIRLKRAAQLLLLHKLNVSEVAYKVGFKDPKYFRKCFQEQFNVTPSDYANQA